MPIDFNGDMHQFVLRGKERINPNDNVLLREEIIVELPKGRTFRFMRGPLVVEGVLTIRDVPNGEDRLVSVFCLTNAKVVALRDVLGRR
jgi:hypothetical protein